MTMRQLFFSLCLCFLTSCSAWAQTWYVSGVGSDANDGKTAKTAFRSLQKAADQVQPGDVVLVGNGIYSSTDRGDGSAVLNITRSGKPGAWITWKAAPGQHPEVRPTGWCGIQVSGSYHVLDGISVIGRNDSIVLLRAQEDAKKSKPDPVFNTNGVFFNGRNNKPDQKPHHLIVRNCTVAKCPGGGVTGIEIDYLTIEDCQIYDNAWFMRYAGSGITTLENWAHDDVPGYHIVVQRNLVWNNKTLVAWGRTGKLSDGNGILFDVTDLATGGGATNPNADAVVKPDSTKPGPAVAKPKRPEWTGRALIANNVSAFNGGSGIHTFRTRHVDILNNTTYHNGGVVGYQELFPNRSDDVVILNNIIVPRPGGQVTSNNRNTNIRWDYNLYPAAQDVFVGAHDVVAAPGFMATQPDLVQADLLKKNLRLAKGSPGLNSGTSELTQKTDILGTARPKGPGNDRGAFEQ